MSLGRVTGIRGIKPSNIFLYRAWCEALGESPSKLKILNRNSIWLRSIRLISTDACLATHVNCNHVNKIGARYKVLKLNGSWARFYFCAYVRPFIHRFYFICERKFYARTHARRNYATVEINPLVMPKSTPESGICRLQVAGLSAHNRPRDLDRCGTLEMSFVFLLYDGICLRIDVFKCWIICL